MIAVMLIGIIVGRAFVSSLTEALSVSAYALTPALVPGMGSGLVGSGLYALCFNTGNMHAACIPMYISYLIMIIFELTGAIFLLMIILGGYQYVISKMGGGGGEEGKARVRFAIIGFIVTALSVYIVDFVLDALI